MIESKITFKDEFRVAVGMMALAVLELGAPTFTDVMGDFAVNVGHSARDWVNEYGSVPQSMKIASVLIKPWTDVMSRIISDAQSEQRLLNSFSLGGING